MELTNSMTPSCSTSVASVNCRMSQKPKIATWDAHAPSDQTHSNLESSPASSDRTPQQVPTIGSLSRPTKSGGGLVVGDTGNSYLVIERCIIALEGVSGFMHLLVARDHRVEAALVTDVLCDDRAASLAIAHRHQLTHLCRQPPVAHLVPLTA
eukprot:5857775-Pyramimonas_sp.AAC.1